MSIIFKPVTISRGRKFRGFAYYLGGDIMYGSFGTPSVRLWDPKAMRYVYANANFCESLEEDPNPSQTEADKSSYLQRIVQEQLSWCKAAHPTASESELKYWARKVLRKFHPELNEYVDQVLPDSRDVVKEVESTLQWAMALKTRPCFMYGRHCPGGKPIPDSRKVSIALKTLTRKGITQLPGFQEAWQFCLAMMDLPMADLSSNAL